MPIFLKSTSSSLGRTFSVGQRVVNEPNRRNTREGCMPVAEKKVKAQQISNLGLRRRIAGQRIIDAMPAMIDEIRAEKEREVWKLRKAILEREQHRKSYNLSAINRRLQYAHKS